jgi:hypothetical protein
MAEPASRANVEHEPSGTEVLVTAMREAFFTDRRDFFTGAEEAGRVTDEPDSKDTAVMASALPTIAESCPKLTAEEARMLPTNDDEYPMKADVPRAQNTFCSLAPLIRMKLVVVAVVRLVAAWKIH